MRWTNLTFVCLTLAGTSLSPQYSAAQSSGTGVHGTVVDEAGQPVANATVRIAILGSQNEIEEGGPVKTDDAGTFRFAESPNAAAQFVFYLIATDSEGIRQGWLEAGDTQPVRSSRPLRVIVKPARELTVNLSDAAGMPVSEAT